MNIDELNREIEAIDTDDATKALLKQHVYLYAQAEQALKEGRYEDGVSVLEMLLEQVPEDINAKTMLAIAYDEAGYPVKGIRLMEEICEIEPENGEYSLMLALAYRRQDWMQKAITQLKITVELTPGSRVAWEHLVECSVETEDAHEAMMNCFGAIYLLKEHGIESIKLNVFAFSFLILDDYNIADKHLTTIINIMRDGEKFENSYYEGAIDSILWEIDTAERYEFMPRIREMVGYLSETSKWLAENIRNTEVNSKIAAIEESFPIVLCSLINHIHNDCGCKDCKSGIISLECSILADHDGYRPELTRLLSEQPELYAMHSSFFNEAVSGVDRDKLLMKRLRMMSDSGLEPILTRADGSELNPDVQTYRREGRKIGRNELCPCNSGIKYKKCCGV